MISAAALEAVRSDPVPVLDRLRVATRAAHARIETVPVLRRLLEPDILAVEYVRALSLLHAFHAALAPQMERALRGRSRACELVDGTAIAAMAADIHWFGSRPMDAASPVISFCSGIDALGALYVIEGSNLGGRLIGRHVARSLGVAPAAGGTFHCGFAQDAGRRRWPLLQDVLRVEVDECGARSEPIAAVALATFDALDDWLREAGSGQY
jgi:heme oxygenase